MKLLRFGFLDTEFLKGDSNGSWRYVALFIHPIFQFLIECFVPFFVPLGIDGVVGELILR